MLDKLRTLLARFIVKYLHHPRPLVIRAWFWLAAETDDLEEKRRCLEAVLELNPGVPITMCKIPSTWQPTSCWGASANIDSQMKMTTDSLG